jgi:hypothetical protein
MYLLAEEEAKFTGLVTEGLAILADEFGSSNSFSNSITSALGQGQGGFFGGPSYLCVSQVVELLNGAINQLGKRGESKAAESDYVAASRLDELVKIDSRDFDLQKLVQLCVELNAAYRVGSYMSVAMLVRSIVDHVPPIFSCNSFAAVGSNYGGSTSFKSSMQHLDKSLRKIADSHLHTQIRRTESTVTAQQVSFSADLDVLLSEVVRLIRGGT